MERLDTCQQADCVDLLQLYKSYGDGMMSNVMPNLSKWFTGRTEVIAKLRGHFSNTNNSAQQRKFFLLYGMGGVGKTQICLKFIKGMSDW